MARYGSGGPLKRIPVTIESAPPPWKLQKRIDAKLVDQIRSNRSNGTPNTECIAETQMVKKYATPHPTPPKLVQHSTWLRGIDSSLHNLEANHLYNAERAQVIHFLFMALCVSYSL